MYFDALTLAAVADELREQILGGRVQRVVLTSPFSIGLEIYARHRRFQLLASAHPQFARVHLVQGKLSRGVEQATPLLLLLRKYVLGGRIAALEQPSLERILVLSIVKESESRKRSDDDDLAQVEGDAVAAALPFSDQEPASDDPDVWVDADDASVPAADRLGAGLRSDPLPTLRCDLIIEPMDRRSNIILVDDNNLILESIKRVTARMSRRVILPRRVYELPPAQAKGDPRNATAAGLEALRRSGERDLARAIVAGYRGVSPLLARELVYRVLGRINVDIGEDLPWYTLAAQLRTLFSGNWQPTLVMGEPVDEPEQHPEPIAYAPYALEHLSGGVAQAGMSAALETFYAAREELTAHRRHRDAVGQQFAAARERLENQRDRLKDELERAQELEQLRWEGEMIFAFLHSIERDQRTLEVEGRTIALEPGRSPVSQAQERFRAYEKARSAVTGLPERLRENELRLEGLEQLRTLLELSDDRAQIDQIALEAEEQSYIRAEAGGSEQSARARKRNAAKIRPLHLVSSEGFDIYVGRSSSQNEEVTFRIGRPDDLWLHVRVIHGAHVIVRSNGRDVPEQTLREAAGLAAYFSRARDEGAVEVDITRRSLVRKIKGGPPGLVSYRAERSLRVPPLPPWG